MELYTKIIDNEQIIKPRNQIVIKTDNNYDIYNPTEQMLIDHGWVKYVEHNAAVIDYSIEEEIQLRKSELKNDIIEYYESDRVKVFYINGNNAWLDNSTRASLILRIDVETYTGKTTTTIWCNGIGYEMNTSKAKELLYSIELYASKCYDNAQTHLQNIDKLNDLDSLDNYNYYEGYPAPIQFDI